MLGNHLGYLIQQMQSLLFKTLETVVRTSLVPAFDLSDRLDKFMVLTCKGAVMFAFELEAVQHCNLRGKQRVEIVTKFTHVQSNPSIPKRDDMKFCAERPLLPGPSLGVGT